MHDLVIIGGGAAGLAAGILTAQRTGDCRIAILDGMERLGAKLLLAGGGRCNVTNQHVGPEHFFGGSPNVIRRVLREFPVEQTIRWFERLGVPLHEEEAGKLFPDSQRASDVVEALVRELKTQGVAILTGRRVSRIEPLSVGFRLHTTHGVYQAQRILLATGGCSVPSTGSDGGGYVLAKSLGHSIVSPVPALAPLTLRSSWCQELAGLTHEVELTLTADQYRKPIRETGSMLWTHTGISGPAVLNISRHWHRANLEKQSPRLTANLLPTRTLTDAEQQWHRILEAQPRIQLHTALSKMIPGRLAPPLLTTTGINEHIPIAHISRQQRRQILQALLNWPLDVTGEMDFQRAEVTAGGVPLTEIEPATLQSRRCPGLYLAGEILDVDGRLGGYNLQWAWASAFVVARSMVADKARSAQ